MAGTINVSEPFTVNEWTHTAVQFRSAHLQGSVVYVDDSLTLEHDGVSVLISFPIDAGRAVAWDQIYWAGSAPGRSSISVRTRFGNTEEELEAARWSAPYPMGGASIRIQGSHPMAGLYAAARYLQYRVELKGVGGSLPVLESIRLTCSLVQPSGFWPSDQAESHPEELVLRWLPVNGSTHYQVQIASDSDFTDPRIFDSITSSDFTPPADALSERETLWWRVRASDGTGKWSKFSSPRSVRITGRRLLDEYKYGQHPRIFFNKSELSEIRRRIESDPVYTRIFGEIKSKADEALDVKTPSQEEVAGVPGQHGGFHELAGNVAQGQLPSLAFTYLITGDERYASAARRIMLSLVSYDRWLGLPFGNPENFDPIWTGTLETSGVARGVATAYDWLHDYLSDDDRAKIREGLVRLGIRPLIHDWADPDSYWKIPRHQIAAGNWWSVCNSGAGVAALALLGEEPEAHRWIRLVEDAIRWFLVYSGNDVFNIDLRAGTGREYLALTEPNWGIDGGYVESIGYITYGLVNALYFVDALKRVTGTDLSPWVRPDILDQPLHFVAHDKEDGYVAVNFNDSGPGKNPPSDIYALIARHTRNPAIQWLLEEMHGGPASLHSMLAYDESLKGDLPADLPKSKHFRDIGWIAFRTGWEKNDSLFAAKFHQGRGHEDLGQFVIYHKGLKQVIDSGSINYADPIYHTFLNQTKAHNVVMVDDQRQLRLDGRVTDFLASDGIGMAVADLTDAYQDLVSEWRRGAAFLDDGIYIIWDRLRSDEPRTYSWLLHPRGEFGTEDGRVSMGKEDARLNLWLMSQSRARMETLPGYICEQEHPYLSWTVKGRRQGDFLGIFADGSFDSMRSLGRTAAEISAPGKRCLVSLGDYSGNESGMVNRFTGEMLAAVGGESDSGVTRVIAYGCSNLELSDLSIKSDGPVSIIAVRKGGGYEVRTGGDAVPNVTAAPGITLSVNP